MAKNTLCIDCNYYNNGWCKKRKTNQGLKDLLDCEYNTNKKIENIEKYEVFGQREIFYYIQKNIDAIKEKTISKKELIKLMLAFEEIISSNEKLFGIYYKGEIDKDIVLDSKNLSKIWKQEIEK